MSRQIWVLSCSVMLLGCGGASEPKEEAKPEKKNVYAGALDKAKELQSNTADYNNRLLQLQEEPGAGAPPDANTQLKAAMNTATAQEKAILIYFTAPSCAECPQLAKFLQNQQPILSKDYVLLHLDFQRVRGSEDTMKHYGGKGGRAGLPWMTIVDAKGYRKATSDGPQGNIGLPKQPDQREHFLKMLRDTGGKITSDEYQTLDEALKTVEKPNTREVLGLPGSGPLRP